MTNKVYGAGGGKSGGHTPVEAADSLRSRQKARIVEVLSEGEIEGPAKPDILKCIYLNGVVIRNDDGSDNFEGVKVVSTTGTPTQEYIPGFSEQESETALGVQVENGVPYTFSVPNRASSGADAVRVTIGIPGLTHINDEGDINGTSVTLEILVQHNGGGFVSKLVDTISGKTTSRYQRAYRISLPQNEAGPWDIKVVRQTPDSSSAKLVNATYLDSYTIISETKMRYTNSAVVGIEIDAEQFSSIPVRGYHDKGIKVRVPDNYDPATRTYTGDWSGGFVTKYTNNPAWLLYDILVENRYGLGRYIDPALIDKWTLYSIAQYCDELVPDGYGGMEPRYTCNLYLQERSEAFTLITNMASIAHAATYGSGGGIAFVQDAPRDPIALFTPANVIEGKFEYSGASIKAQHNVVLVSWNDPADLYRQKIEYVEDAESVEKYGIVQKEVVAMGCTSRGQARRFGRAVIYAEKHESEAIKFAAAYDSYKIYPGAVFNVADPTRTRVRNGGRLLSATASAVELDAPVSILDGIGHQLRVVLPDGSVEARTVTSSGENLTSLTVTPAFSQIPVKMAMWVLESLDKPTESWVCLSAEEKGDTGHIEIVGMAYNPDKYALIESDSPLPPAPEYNPYLVSPPPKNLTASVYLNPNKGLDLLLSWEAADGSRMATVSWKRDDDNYETVNVYGNAYTLRNVSIGLYTFIVSTTNGIGVPSPGATLTYNVVSASVLPDVTGLSLRQPFLDKFASFAWDLLPTADSYKVQIVAGGLVVREVIVTDNWYIYDYAESVADGGGTPFRAFTIQVKARYSGVESGNWASLAVSNAAPPVPAASVLAITGGFQVSAPLPADTDYAGMIVWASTSAAFTPSDANKVYDGANNSVNIIDWQPGVPVYVRAAFYDVYGRTGLNLTSEYSVTPLSNVADIDTVVELPATGPFDGKVVYLLTDKKLYRWDEANTQWITWVDGSDLLAASVTAGKISVTELSALSGNMGTINAGNITLDQAGFIQGGSSAYNTGKGFWMGYHSGQYKFSLGDPAGQHITWDGANLNIGTNVDYANISGTKPPADATYNEFRGEYDSLTTYKAGAVVTKDGSAWTARTTTTGNAPPTLPTISNTWWALYASQGPQGEPGVNGTRTAILEMYQAATSTPTTFPSGTSTYTWSTGQFTAPATTNGWSVTPPTPDVGELLYIVRQVYSDQNTSTTSDVTWSANSCREVANGVDGTDGTNGTRTAFLELYKWSSTTPDTFPSGNSTYTWADGSFTAPGTANGWSLTPGAPTPGQTLWGCSVRYADQDITTTTSIPWNTTTAYAVGAAGTDGASAKLAVLTASSQVFKIDKQGVASPSSITLTAYGQNVAGSPTFTLVSGTASLTGTGNSRSLAYADLITDSATFKITWDGQEDFVTISKVREGVDGQTGDTGLAAITVVFSNEAHTLPADVSGNVLSYANSGSTIQVYEGTTLLAAGSATPGSFLVNTPTQSPAATIAAPGAITYGANSATIGNHGGMAQGTDTCTLTYTIMVARANGTYTFINKVQTLTKSKTGAKGDTGATGATGTDAITILLSNEAHTLPASYDGIVSSYLGSGTEVRVYEGTTQLLANAAGNGKFTLGVITQNPGSTIVPGNRTYDGYVGRVGDHSSMVVGTDSVVLTIPVTVTRLNGTVTTVYKTQTVTKSKAGTPGIDGKDGAGGPSVVVTASRATAFTSTDGNIDPKSATVNQDITFTAVVDGFVSPTITWSFSGFTNTPANSGLPTQTITRDQFGTSKAATVTCTVTGAEGTAKEVITVVRLEKSTAAAGADVTSTKLETGVTINSGGITMGSGGAIKGGQTDYNVGTGWFLGYSNGYKFSIGSPAGDRLTWDGSELLINGTLTADAINAVNTINLAGQAVTIPVSAYTSDVINVYATEAEYTLQTAVIDATGAPIQISYSSFVDGHSSNNETGAIKLRLYRNGVLLHEIFVREKGTISGTVYYVVASELHTAMLSDNPGAGTHTYTLKMIFCKTCAGYAANSGAYIPVSKRGIYLLETKR